MRTIKLFSLLALILGMMSMTEAKAQTTNWIFSDGNGKYSNWKIVESGHEITEVYMAGGTVQNPTWVKCSIEKLDDQYTYTYIRVKGTSSQGTKIYELNLYWDEDKLTRVKPDGSTKNFWLEN
jgi:hypothetical protein